MGVKVVTVSFEVDTNKEESIIRSAVLRGLYYGLDIRKVGRPKDVEFTHLQVEDKNGLT